MIFAPMVLNVLAYKINSVDNGSNVIMGPFQEIDLFVSYKRNQGMGELNGDFSPYFAPVAWLIDTDLADSNSVKNSLL
ncbi:hypothetical protein [Peribacillus sp. SCS-155]|uniref:hypothetical protein n=1 Tax=Peribacillus sedimenti TaxID=3115297 RepID=UPI003905F5DA